MRKFLLFLLLAAALAIPVLGQNTSTFGNITAGAANCGGANCVYYQLPPGTPWVVTTISGNWSGTINFALVNAPNANYSNLNAVAWNTVATETANGTWSISAAGATYVLVQASVWNSGAANVTMLASQNGAPLINPVFAGTITAEGLNFSTLTLSATSTPTPPLACADPFGVAATISSTQLCIAFTETGADSPTAYTSKAAATFQYHSSGMPVYNFNGISGTKSYRETLQVSGFFDNPAQNYAELVTPTCASGLGECGGLNVAVTSNMGGVANGEEYMEGVRSQTKLATANDGAGGTAAMANVAIAATYDTFSPSVTNPSELGAHNFIRNLSTSYSGTVTSGPTSISTCQVASITFSAGSGQTPGTYPLTGSGGSAVWQSLIYVTVQPNGTVTTAPFVPESGNYPTSAGCVTNVPTFTLSAGGTPSTLTPVMSAINRVKASDSAQTWTGTYSTIYSDTMGGYGPAGTHVIFNNLSDFGPELAGDMTYCMPNLQSSNFDGCFPLEFATGNDLWLLVGWPGPYYNISFPFSGSSYVLYQGAWPTQMNKSPVTVAGLPPYSFSTCGASTSSPAFNVCANAIGAVGANASSLDEAQAYNDVPAAFYAYVYRTVGIPDTGFLFYGQNAAPSTAPSLSALVGVQGAANFGVYVQSNNSGSALSLIGDNFNPTNATVDEGNSVTYTPYTMWRHRYADGKIHVQFSLDPTNELLGLMDSSVAITETGNVAATGSISGLTGGFGPYSNSVKDSNAMDDGTNWVVITGGGASNPVLTPNAAPDCFGNMTMTQVVNPALTSAQYVGLVQTPGSNAGLPAASTTAANFAGFCLAGTGVVELSITNSVNACFTTTIYTLTASPVFVPTGACTATGTIGANTSVGVRCAGACSGTTWYVSNAFYESGVGSQQQFVCTTNAALSGNGQVSNCVPTPAVGGAGAALVTGPSSGTTAGHVVTYADTAGTTQDGGKGIGGAGAALVTGPSSGTTAGHVVTYTDTQGTTQDGGRLPYTFVGQFAVNAGDTPATSTTYQIGYAWQAAATTGLDLQIPANCTKVVAASYTVWASGTHDTTNNTFTLEFRDVTKATTFTDTAGTFNAESSVPTVTQPGAASDTVAAGDNMILLLVTPASYGTQPTGVYYGGQLWCQ